VKEHPILFSAPMVRALLAGTKTQTRRVVKGAALEWLSAHNGFTPEFVALPENHLCPYGVPGDRLWVRETSRAHEISTTEAMTDTFKLGDRLGEAAPCGLDGVAYLADGAFREIENTREAAERWMAMNAYRGQRGAVVPGIHMPRWASRITLEVTGVRAERLQDISEADAGAEGVDRFHAPVNDPAGRPYYLDYSIPGESDYTFVRARDSYRTLWEHINGLFSWDANPWVWVVEFRRAP
jgi:hypothetical protein